MVLNDWYEAGITVQGEEVEVIQVGDEGNKVFFDGDGQDLYDSYDKDWFFTYEITFVYVTPGSQKLTIEVAKPE